VNKPKFSNRLINETSPYLLQHAHNPVDWFAWNEEVFEKTVREDKPVLISIGKNYRRQTDGLSLRKFCLSKACDGGSGIGKTNFPMNILTK